VGERGVSALIAIFCAFFAQAVHAAFARDRRRSLQYASIGVAIPIAMIVAGVFRIRAIDEARTHAPHARVALAEPSTEAKIRWEPGAAEDIMRRLTMLTIEIGRASCRERV